MKTPLKRLDQSGAADGEVPVWNDTAGRWEPGTVTGGGGGLDVGSTSDLRVQPTGLLSAGDSFDFFPDLDALADPEGYREQIPSGVMEAYWGDNSMGSPYGVLLPPGVYTYMIEADVGYAGGTLPTTPNGNAGPVVAFGLVPMTDPGPNDTPPAAWAYGTTDGPTFGFVTGTLVVTIEAYYAVEMWGESGSGITLDPTCNLRLRRLASL